MCASRLRRRRRSRGSSRIGGSTFHWRPSCETIWALLIQGSLAIVVCYAMFYISTVFALGYGVGRLEFRASPSWSAVRGGVFMALVTPFSAALADRFGRRPVLLASADLAIAVVLAMPALLRRGRPASCLPRSRAGAMGLTFAPLGALLPELFPPGPLHGRVEHVQSRRHPRRLLRAVAGATFGGERRRGLGWLLHRGGRRDQLFGCVQHAGDEGNSFAPDRRLAPAPQSC